MSVHEGLVLVWVEPNRLLGLLLLTFPTHEVALHVCDNSLAPSLADLGNALGVYVESTIAQPNRVGVGNNSARVHRYHAVAVLMHVAVDPNELTDWEFWFEGLLHDFDSSNLSGRLNT